MVEPVLHYEGQRDAPGRNQCMYRRNAATFTPRQTPAVPKHISPRPFPGERRSSNQPIPHIPRMGGGVALSRKPDPAAAG
jgi:hypothetical protein